MMATSCDGSQKQPPHAPLSSSPDSPIHLAVGFFLLPRVPPEEHRDDVRHSAGKQSPRPRDRCQRKALARIQWDVYERVCNQELSKGI
jgi:hypothetical protein